MTQNEMSAVAVAIFIGFALVRGIFRMLRNLAGGNTGQMDRINAAAKKVLAEQQQAMRSSGVPATNTKGAGAKPQRGTPLRSSSAAKAKPARQARTADMQKSQTASAALLSTTRTPAIVRTGVFSGKEPVIQRRR
jgi:hypothetical protein